jgi:hypothetical protein
MEFAILILVQYMDQETNATSTANKDVVVIFSTMENA